jgi:hypothetical protein
VADTDEPFVNGDSMSASLVGTILLLAPVDE